MLSVGVNAFILHTSVLFLVELTALDLAIRIRTDVLKATGCTASAGMARNILLARMATRKAKPNGQFHLQNDDIKEFIGILFILSITFLFSITLMRIKFQ